MTSATDKLLPCPFCGSGAEVFNWHSPHPHARGVGCKNDECVFQPWSAFDNDLDAIESWNTRHNPDDTKGNQDDKCNQ